MIYILAKSLGNSLLKDSGYNTNWHDPKDVSSSTGTNPKSKTGSWVPSSGLGERSGSDGNPLCQSRSQPAQRLHYRTSNAQNSWTNADELAALCAFCAAWLQPQHALQYHPHKSNKLLQAQNGQSVGGYERSLAARTVFVLVAVIISCCQTWNTVIRF